jgi:hypothetical protein
MRVDGEKVTVYQRFGKDEKDKKTTGQRCLSDLPRQCIAQKRYEMNEWILLK